jgi:type I restriction enzyme R subunit
VPCDSRDSKNRNSRHNPPIASAAVSINQIAIPGIFGYHSVVEIMSFNTEADARINIDQLLREAGWDPADKRQVGTEVPIQIDSLIGELDSFQTSIITDTSTTYIEAVSSPLKKADYVLYASDGRPLAVVEAKRDGIDPYRAKSQALRYARAIGAPFVFLSNGDIIYFWDCDEADARSVASFFSQRDLERLVHQRKNRMDLALIPIIEDYIRGGEVRFLRPYQGDCMSALDSALLLGKRRFLIELPTGTGKTDLIILYVRRLLKAGHAERVLFLVDRDSLAKQAIETIQDLLPDHSSYWLKAGTAPQHKEITVCLIQTMMSRYRAFTSGYFDVVITDESHRSIYGSWRPALEHFDAFHVGLTATPARYIERNTFDFYHCVNQQPDFSYPIEDAFQNQYLVPYKFAEGITQLLSDPFEADGEEYNPTEFERRWTNHATNELMMKEFDRLAHENYRDLAPGLTEKDAPGKAIVFAITKNHATRLAKILNDLHPEAQGRYAEVITSDVADADGLIRKFKREAYPRVAVSVGMLDTGFDCREVLHLVMCRRVRSPILYQQMRGRGTRTAPHIKKRGFVIYDFFKNHEYFGDTDDHPFTGTGIGGSSTGKPPGPGGGELVELEREDHWRERVTYVEVGPQDTRIDKDEYRSRWEQTIRAAQTADPVLAKIKAGQDLTDEEQDDLSRRLNENENYFNEENLRHAYRTPEGTIIDFIRAALGLAQVKTREERIDDNFRAWLVSHQFTPEQATFLSMLKARGLANGHVELSELFEPPLVHSNAPEKASQLFGSALKSVVEDLNTIVFDKPASA